MPSNVYINFEPELWNSAYSDIEWKLEFKTKPISSTTNVTKAQINVSTNFEFVPIVNEYVLIDSGVYQGLWRVLSGTINSVTIDTAYVSNQTTGTVKHLRVPTFNVYKGFDSTELFPTQLPLELVTSINYTFGAAFDIKINLKGIAQRIFTVVPPPLTATYCFDIFNQLRLTWDDQESTPVLVLNSSIPTIDLITQYIGGLKYLSDLDRPLMMSCGRTFLVRFKENFPVLELFEGGEVTKRGFSSAFQTNQFNQSFN